ncbi:MAG: hypothetical protein DI565_00615 [Ancylobacter novellus]|uniref:Uncharacterized protein n=1 Tax=Ancylobacter novellus TaxID=921 RepID=A0A2W5KPJ6_ANCNO|nr:MAG: hypothetical protein DI565_00615 [Ancylobacter novellus]
MAEIFDLLGDPIPEGHGRRGRPQHIATRENRCKVIMLLGLGWSNDRIARALSITAPTLRKNYFRELAVRDEARDRVFGSLFARCYEAALDGNVGAIKEFQRMVERNDMMLGLPVARADKPAPEPKLGKKEAQLRDAHTPALGSTLGELMAQRMASKGAN